MDKGGVVLANGFRYPLLGFGSWGLRGNDLNSALCTALDRGYKLLDTSGAYGNEQDVGYALKRIHGSEDVVVQSKVGPRQMGYQGALGVARGSISKIGRLDVLLVHWPGRDRRLRFETWRALEDLYKEGTVKVIGVSNFLPEHIDELKQDGMKVKPMVNQFELHLLCQNKDVVKYCHKEGIAVQSYSTLGGGPAQGTIRLEHGTAILLSHPVLQQIAKEVARSTALVCLRWAVQQGFAVIPKSTKTEHILDNTNVFNFELSDGQMARLAEIDQDHHFAWDPRQTLSDTKGIKSKGKSKGKGYVQKSKGKVR